MFIRIANWKLLTPNGNGNTGKVLVTGMVTKITDRNYSLTIGTHNMILGLQGWLQNNIHELFIDDGDTG